MESIEKMIEKDPRAAYVQEKYAVKLQNLINVIDKDIFVQQEMDKLKFNNVANYHLVISTVAHFALNLVTGITKIVVKRDFNNTMADESPPVLPLELCSISPQDFSDSLKKQKLHIKQKYLEE